MFKSKSWPGRCCWRSRRYTRWMWTIPSRSSSWLSGSSSFYSWSRQSCILRCHELTVLARTVVFFRRKFACQKDECTVLLDQYWIRKNLRVKPKYMFVYMSLKHWTNSIHIIFKRKNACYFHGRIWQHRTHFEFGNYITISCYKAHLEWLALHAWIFIANYLLS